MKAAGLFHLLHKIFYLFPNRISYRSACRLVNFLFPVCSHGNNSFLVPRESHLFLLDTYHIVPFSMPSNPTTDYQYK